MKPDINWFGAIIFFLLFIVGPVTFVISPTIENYSWVPAFLFGALFGFDNLCHLLSYKPGYFEKLACISYGN